MNARRSTRHPARHRTAFPGVALALALVIALCAGLHQPPLATGAENVLIVIADDYGADGSSLYNNHPSASIPPTPNITALARSGVVFHQAWANPVCSPTRASILTGRHAFRTGVGDVIAGPASPSLPASEFTLADAFASAPAASLGYQSALFGKWHLGGGQNAPRILGGWTHFAGSLPGAIANYTNWTKTINGTSTANHPVYATTDAVNDALAWIQARGSQPWLVCVALNAPHTPYHKPPASLCPHYASLPGTQADINANSRAYYEAAVEALDTEFGRLLAGIPRTNTHIVFLGDNGTPRQVLQPPWPATGRGKDTLYESGVRVPLIIAGPSVTQPARTNTSPIHAVDLFATAIELAGLSVPSAVPSTVTLDSASLVPLLRDPNASRSPAFSEVFDNSNPTGTRGRTLRNADWKLIAFDDGRREFYHLANDPTETNDLLSLTSPLSGTQSNQLHALSTQLAAFQSDWSGMTITNHAASATPTPTRFSVTAAWRAGVQHTLWRAPGLDPASDTEAASSDANAVRTPPASWTPVPSAVAVTNVAAGSITLTDPAPPAGTSIYRLTTWTATH